MILFLDTSALVPLLVAEPATPVCQDLWASASRVVVLSLAHVEASAALAQAERTGRLTTSATDRALDGLEILWGQVAVLAVTGALVQRAGVLARRHGLRGYDAMQCAAGESVSASDMVAATGDRVLLGAWVGLGLSTADTVRGTRPG